MALIPVIGLEMHAEMKSTTKVFSPAENTYNDISNLHVNKIDMAFPGILPLVNFECMNKAIEMALILNCKIPEMFMFDRKNYYYPDLPKGYQITQFTKPIGTNGYLNIDVNGEEKKVEILDIHLEEDSASLDHYSYYSLIDYNRAGVPLLETVTAPCLHSASEAVAFLDTMKNIFRYTGISDADIKCGQIRCDVNVSMMEEGSSEFGTKVEVKNVNNIQNVANTIEYEIKRQTELIESGRKDEIVQETRRYDESTNTTITMRSKADAIDYKYFVEPNIPPYKINEELIETIRKQIPVLPNQKKLNYINKLGINSIDANILVKDKDISDYFDELIRLGSDIKMSSNWVINQIMDYINSNDVSIKELYLTPDKLKFIMDQVLLDKISNKQAKELFLMSLELKREPSELIGELGMEQLNDMDEIKSLIINILDNNPKQVEEYKNGKTNMFQYFVGQVMKQTSGKANPVLVREILTALLSE
ncbi:MAG: Asp-tRNA(Asn)/Glu-tRNA(Gln) amidotransferase subunit GatB [Bacilli bacterium]|nr:Asp-tRNA(Asn)/Glu-tRNA(Gln) amidotransferase subunit GatB [Bacilli bacterium]